MKASDRSKFLLLMSFHLLWGAALWFSISKFGLGVSTDSVHLLFGAQNLAESGRLISFDSTPLLEWPPLYPAILGGIRKVTGLSTFGAAHLAQFAAFAGQSACLSLLFLRIFPESFALALAGNVLADIGVVVVAGFDLLGPDYAGFFLMTLVALLAGEYIEQRSPKIYVALAAAGMLAMLQRYLGIAAIATGVVSVLLFRGSNLRRRIMNGFFLALPMLPTAIWYFETSGLVSRRAPISFSENFLWFSRSIGEWVLPGGAISSHLELYMLVFWAALAGLVALVAWTGRDRLTTDAKTVLLSGLLYLLVLFGSASLTYFNKLGGRFLLPLYIPFVTLILLSVQAVVDRAGKASPARQGAARAGAGGIVALMALLLFLNTWPVILRSHSGSGTGENAFNTAAWRSNDAINFWRAHPPHGAYRLFSNSPDSLAFYTAHACEPSPRQFSGPYATLEYPIEGYASSLFTSGQPTYLIWIESNAHDYYYRPQDLAAIADVEALFTGSDGGIYRLTPKTQP